MEQLGIDILCPQKKALSQKNVIYENQNKENVNTPRYSLSNVSLYTLAY
jgi:hypothetical protein